MELRRVNVVVVVAGVCLSLIVGLAAGQQQTPHPVLATTSSPRRLAVQSKETTTADFIRLVVMRLIFGLASAMGYGEGLSNFLGGIFVPPGADYDDEYNDYVPDLF